MRTDGPGAEVSEEDTHMAEDDDDTINTTAEPVPVEQGTTDPDAGQTSAPAAGSQKSGSNTLGDIFHTKVGPYSTSVWLLIFAVVLGYASYGMPLMRDIPYGMELNGYELLVDSEGYFSDFYTIDEAGIIRYVPTVALIVLLIVAVLVLLPRMRIEQISRYTSKLNVLQDGIIGKYLVMVLGVVLVVLAVLLLTWSGNITYPYFPEPFQEFETGSGANALLVSGLLIAFIGFMDTQRTKPEENYTMSLLLFRDPSPRVMSETEPEQSSDDFLTKLTGFFSDKSHMTIASFLVGGLLVLLGVYYIVSRIGDDDFILSEAVSDLGVIVLGLLVLRLAKGLYEGKIVEKVDIMSRVIMTLGMGMMLNILFGMFYEASFSSVIYFMAAAFLYLYGEYMERDKTPPIADKIVWVLMMVGSLLVVLWAIYNLVRGMENPSVYMLMNVVRILAGLFILFLTLDPGVRKRMGI